MDLNGDISKFAEMDEAIPEGEVWDMSSVAHWDLDHEGIGLPTCRGHGSRADTLRDYLFCNAQLLPEVRAFRRGPFAEVDVPAMLYATLQRNTASAEVWKHCKPRSVIPERPDEDAHTAWETRAQASIARRMQAAARTLE